MGNRYVWDRYDTKEVLEKGEYLTKFIFTSNGNSMAYTAFFSKYYINKSTIYPYYINVRSYDSEGNYDKSDIGIASINSPQGYIPEGRIVQQYSYNSINKYNLPSDIIDNTFISGANSRPYLEYYPTGGWDQAISDVYRAVLAMAKGDSLLGVSASANNAAYPQNGASGTDFYVFKGSDSIDPASLSYPASPKSTVPITITVAPAAGNVYGGTVSYQYEVSLDGGGSWAQLGLTTALTMDYTIPKGTQTFRARVQARDDLGFTSSEWIYGPQVAVINNAAPSAPGSITVPVSPRGGADTAVTWTRAEDPDGNLAGYRLERQLDGGAWSQIYDGQGLSHVDVIPKGTLTAAYRVKAYDSDGEEGPYTTSPVRTVVNNSPPVISCDLSGDLGVKSAGFTVSYTVTDAEGGAVTVEERAGGLVKRTFSPTLGQSNTFQVTGEFFMRILNGPQELSIVATDEGGLSSVCTLTFTKKVYAMSVTLAQPLEVNGPITVAIMSVLQSIPEDAAYQILVTNNAKDAQPAWQDATADVRAGRNIVFTNQTQESGPAFNFRLTASRAEGGQGGYVKLLKGAFQ